MTEELALKSYQGKEIFPFRMVLRLAVGPPELAVQSVPGTVSPGMKWKGCKVDRLPLSVAKVKNGGAVAVLFHTSSWHGAQLIKHRA
jgi:hypothetical protein